MVVSSVAAAPSGVGPAADGSAGPDTAGAGASGLRARTTRIPPPTPTASTSTATVASAAISGPRRRGSSGGGGGPGRRGGEALGDRSQHGARGGAGAHRGGGILPGAGDGGACVAGVRVRAVGGCRFLIAPRTRGRVLRASGRRGMIGGGVHLSSSSLDSPWARDAHHLDAHAGPARISDRNMSNPRQPFLKWSPFPPRDDRPVSPGFRTDGRRVSISPGHRARSALTRRAARGLRMKCGGLRHV